MSVEDRIRTATAATAATVREIRPLARPAAPETVTGTRPNRLPLRRGLLIPLAVAAAVVAVAATLVAVRNLTGTHSVPASPAHSAVLPRYAVICAVEAKVVDTRTGRILATFKPPAHTDFTGVAGAADDRTFVVDAAPSLDGPATAHSWYLLRIIPGAARPARLTPLTITGIGRPAFITGLAVSPDGRTLAVLYLPAGLGTGGDKTSVLRTYSVATGTPLRTWTGPPPSGGIGSYAGLDDNVDGLTWLANGSEIAFTYPGRAVRLLDTASPGHDLVASSRVLFTPPADAAGPCQQALLTPDGRTVVCGSMPLITGGNCDRQALEFEAYSAATAKRERVLFRYRGTCTTNGVAQLIWAGSGISAIVQIQALHIPKGTHRGYQTEIIGRLTPGRLTPLRVPPIPIISPPGSIAF